MEWIDFDRSKFHHQKLPKEKRHMLVQVAAKPDEGLPPAVAVGYLKFAAGCKDSPYFVVPGVGGDVVAWCDCLGDAFMAPLWPGTHKRPNDQK